MNRLSWNEDRTIVARRQMQFIFNPTLMNFLFSKCWRFNFAQANVFVSFCSVVFFSSLHSLYWHIVISYLKGKKCQLFSQFSQFYLPNHIKAHNCSNRNSFFSFPLHFSVYIFQLTHRQTTTHSLTKIVRSLILVLRRKRNDFHKYFVIILLQPVLRSLHT